MKPRILIVDDEPRMGAALATALRRSGYTCEAMTSGADALELFDREGADVVITDRRMPGIDGDELMRRLKEKAPELPVILITAYGDVRSAVKAMRDGAFDYVTKPFDNDELRGLVARALELRRLRQENRRLRQEVGDRFGSGVVAESPAMKEILALIDRAAPSDASVLIQGESGTGKEVIAKRLHFGPWALLRSDASPRLSQPFVAVNCKAFAPGVLESELFGHRTGDDPRPWRRYRPRRPAARGACARDSVDEPGHASGVPGRRHRRASTRCLDGHRQSSRRSRSRARHRSHDTVSTDEAVEPVRRLE